MSTLYIVATPIGNLEDITLRALRTLKEADIILCEDTRVTRVLLEKYGIKTPTESYHARSRFSKTEKILEWLKEGKNIALISDSGTPAISDPGSHLVSLARKEFGDEVSVVAVPGASALTAAFSISGFPGSQFLFFGFLPHKKGREMLFKEIAASKRPVVFYESPHRIMKTLMSLKKILLGARIVFIARELTKIYEEGVTGTAGELLSYFEENKQKIRGEFVVIVSGT